MINLHDIIFYSKMNEDIYILSKMIEVIWEKNDVQFECKEVKNDEMLSMNMIEFIDDSKFMIEQLIMKKKRDREYIIREIIHWMNMKLNIYEELSDRCDKYNLKNLKIMNDYIDDDWDELMSDEEW